MAVELGPWKHWMMAARPATLPAGVLPVVMASALAHHDGGARLDVAVISALGAMLIQIGTNLFNDWADFFRGADTEHRLGPKRVTQQGLIAPGAVFWTALAAFALAACCGLYLIPIGGVPIVAVGVMSIAAGILYTGGPYPLAYHGLGDLFVFIFFGPVAVIATYFLHLGHVSFDSLLLGAAIGLFATAILVVNNLRDRHTDRRANKKTLVVRFGPGPARAQYMACVLLPYVITAVLAFRLGPMMLAPMMCLPMAQGLIKRILTQDGADLNPLLGHTARLEAVWTALCSAALMA